MACETPLPIKNTSSLLPYPNERIPDNVLRKAEMELRETTEIKQQALVQLKDMLQGNSKTEKIHFEDDLLIHYLRASKYTTGKSFKQLLSYVDFRTKHSYMFEGIPDEYFFTKRSIGMLSVLPERCPEGCIVYYVQIGKWKPSEFSVETIKKFSLSSYLQLSRDPMVQINGFKAIYDFEGTNIHQLQALSLHNLYLLYHVPVNCYPSRIKAVHFVNQTSALNWAWKFMYPLLSDKLRKRCHFHSDVSKLLEFFPSSMVPAKYGGDLTDIDSTELFRSLNKEQQNHTIQGQANFY